MRGFLSRFRWFPPIALWTASASNPYLPLRTMGTSSEASDEKHQSDKHDLVAVSAKEVDTAAELASGEQGEVDPEEALRVRRKIDKHILPLMCILYWIQFMDKTTLGSSAILGIREATHLSTNQYNWLGTIFYLSYLAFEFPQNLCLQRFPVGKWMSFNIFIWAIALSTHAACKNFAGLFVVRLILGVCEGSITAGFMIVSSMFYTRREQTLRVGYWFLMNGTAQIISGFISFGALHIKTKSFEPWQWLMIITGILTLFTALAFWFLFPDSPTNAWFLTPAERSIAVRRIKENQTGVENKHFKKEQMIEALLDPKTWLFALFSALDNVPNSLTNQRQIIVSSFGFTPLQTTLLGCVDGVIEIVTIYTGVNLAARWPDSRAYVAFVYFIPNIMGVFLINFLPWSNKVGLLFGQWTTGVGTTGFVLSLSWLSSVTAGHTKRVTVNAIMLSAYCIGNSAGPFMWQAKYKPRNHIPWIIIGICYVCCMVLLLAIRYVLSSENKRRDNEPIDDTYDDVYIERIGKDGETEKVRVDKEFLDLTDIQNRDFRYVL
ncbi:MFS general substrate transporter [Flammula alnicola]|nr:MFS general substrate transporter [Flammula alnicola]